MSRGWISLHRKILDNPILKTSKKFSTFEAFVWLLLNVNHKERKVVMGSNIYKCKKGQMITSQKKLCKRFGWGNSRLRTFLLILQKDEMIVVKTNQQLTQISVLKYDTYQDTKLLPNHNQIATKSQPNTNNNDNNVNNDNKEKRELKFNEKVKKIFDEKYSDYDIGILENFCNYWTESNVNGKKMRFEKESIFDLPRRLSTWIKNSEKWDSGKVKVNITDYTLDATGYCFVGYCAKCNISDFYKEFELKGDSRCCQTKINPQRRVK